MSRHDETARRSREMRGAGVCTAERLQRADGRMIVDQSGCQVVNQSVLDTLYYFGRIDGRLYEAGDRLREDTYAAGMVWSQTSLRAPGSRTRADQRLPGFAHGEESAAFGRWARAAASVSREEARVLSAIIWPRDSGINVQGTLSGIDHIREALDSLAKHYRLR